MEVTPAQRLKDFLDYKKISFNDFAKAILAKTLIGNSSKYIGEGQKSVIGFKYANNFSNIGLNYNWYLTGEGSMIIEEKIETNLNEIILENERLKTEVKLLREFYGKPNFQENAETQETRSGLAKTKHSKQPSK